MTLPAREANPAPLISIVDDEECVREALVSLLRSTGYTTAEFATAESFLASSDAPRTRCLILDLHLPAMCGLDLQQRLAEQSPQPPIIFVSADATAQEKRQAMSGGAVTFLSKPFRDQTLLDAVALAIG